MLPFEGDINRELLEQQVIGRLINERELNAERELTTENIFCTGTTYSDPSVLTCSNWTFDELCTYVTNLDRLPHMDTTT